MGPDQPKMKIFPETGLDAIRAIENKAMEELYKHTQKFSPLNQEKVNQPERTVAKGNKRTDDS